MDGAPVMTRRDGSLIGRMGAGLMAVFIALMMALTLPAVSTGLDAQQTALTDSGELTIAALIAPDLLEIIPAAEASAETERTRASDTPAILADAATEIVPLASRATVYERFHAPVPFDPSTVRPFSRGPPLFS